MDSVRDTLSGGLPHSEIPGSTIARISPGLFAACHVLHRLSVPRHPPDALLFALERHTKRQGCKTPRALIRLADGRTASPGLTRGSPDNQPGDQPPMRQFSPLEDTFGHASRTAPSSPGTSGQRPRTPEPKHRPQPQGMSASVTTRFFTFQSTARGQSSREPQATNIVLLPSFRLA